MAQLWRRAWGWSRLLRSDGHRSAATSACLRTNRWTASELNGRPVRVGKSGSPGWPPRSAIQPARVAAVPVLRGTARCLRPLPFSQWTLAGAKGDVVAVQPGELGDTQTGSDRDEEQRPVSAAFPTVQVGCVNERVDLLGGEERHQRPFEAFGWYCQDVGTLLRVRGAVGRSS